jgi:SpoVK/Ycf46/Vps4 family AAA+-type ATPase
VYHFAADWPTEVTETQAAVFRARLFELVEGIVDPRSTPSFAFSAGFGPAQTAASSAAERSTERSTERSGEEGDGRTAFTPIAPRFSFDRLVLPAETLERILDLVALVELRPLVFDTWGLSLIEPNPSVAVNFRGPPGTGKTMAAHAVAERLGRPIMLSRLSDLESKFHGDGPKNLVELFRSAKEHDALLFLDEAESLLSRRYASPDQAAENAINSMRTELLMALDSFEGVVVFATNLPDSYDSAIDSRLFHVDFPMPDATALEHIWRAHLPAALPLAPDVSVPQLAAVAGVAGRDVQRAVISAALATARAGEDAVAQARLLAAIRAQASRGPQPGVGGGADASAGGAAPLNGGGRALDAAEREALGRRIESGLGVTRPADSAAL